MKSFKDMLLERSVNPAEKLGCLMAMVDESFEKKIVDFGNKLIQDENVYHKIDDETGEDEYGREKDCHVTIRYGFTKDLNELDVRQLLKGQREFSVKAIGLSIFDSNPEFDVVKLDIESPILTRLNQMSGIYPNKTDFPNYHPHMTLAYVKKGTFPYKKKIELEIPILSVCYSPASGAKSNFPLKEGHNYENIDAQISRLEQEWERLDASGTGMVRQREIQRDLIQLRFEKSIQDTPDDTFELEKEVDPETIPVDRDKAKNLFANIRKSLAINEWVSHGNAVNRSPDDNLYATPGGFNDGSPHWNDKDSFDVNSSNIAENWNADVGDWDGIIEGKDWFCYVEGNDWQNKMSGASIYITEDDKPHKFWIRIKTHGLRKNGDTNESYKERVRKHSHKVARSWMSAAKQIHNNVELNEVGNPIPVTWKHAFKEALKDSKVKGFIAEVGEKEMSPIADPVNFTPRIGETNDVKPKKISYSAVVLTNEDQNRLKSLFKNHLPNGWAEFAHHMTICMGPLPDSQKKDLGKSVTLTCTELGESAGAIALKVTGYPSSNTIPHITLFVNVKGGNKPVDSNKITNWQTLPRSFTVKGIVSEIDFKN